jgi:hypothetical protein
MKEKRLRLLVALGALPMALAACGATPENKGGPGDPPGGVAAGPNGAAGGAVVGAGGAGQVGPGTSGGAGTVVDHPPTCTAGIPVTTQIPLLLNRQYASVVRDLLGVTAIDSTPVADFLVGDFTGAMTAPAWKVYQDAGAKIAKQVMAGANKAKFISCAPTAADCLKTTVQTFGRKAFRRALTDEEVTSFMSLNSVTPAGTPDQVAEAILNAFLISPSFLLIPELTTEVDATYTATPNAIKLSQQEVATRLSFLLWGSVPDDALNAAADAGQLSTKDQILAQATRMIQVREKTGGFISAFHEEWAQMNNSSAHWFKGKHDTAVYPEYTDASRVANKAELDAFFEEVAYTNGSFKDLLLSNVAFVNKDNAALYGLDASKYTDTLTKVTLDSTTNPRPGFLTRAGFLSSYSGFGTTSPILRGSYMAIWLLSINVPAPDPAFAMQTVTGNFMTQRAYVEELTQKNQPCKGCHEVFNPLGFIMESYDGNGKWQTKDPKGGAIDSKVTTATFNFKTGAKEISSPVQLMQEIAKQSTAQALYAQAWVSFATGRNPNDQDQCTVNALQTKLAGDGYSILGLLGDLTQTDSFRLRVRGSL